MEDEARELPELPELIICPRSRVGKHLLSRSRGPRIGYLISIGDPGERLPAGYERAPRRLRLTFEDVDVAGGRSVCASDEDVARLIAVARVIKESGFVTLIHCAAGISRSTAAGLIVLAVALGPGHEARALAEVLRLVPGAHPNALMVELADRLLARGGALIGALHAWRAR